MDYQNQDILRRIRQEQIQNRLRHTEIYLQPSYHDQIQTNYKQNYYKDLFQLENKLQKFQRNDKIYNDVDLEKKERIRNLINKRMNLKEKEDEFYQNIIYMKNVQNNPSVYQPNQQDNNYFSPQVTNKSNNDRNIFTSAGRVISTKNERIQNNMFSNMSLDDFKRMRFLNEKIPLNNVDISKINNNLEQFSQLVSKQPYVNNILNLQHDINSEKQIIDYLKALQNDLNLQSNTLGQHTQQYQDKIKQIEHIRQILFFIQKKVIYFLSIHQNISSNPQRLYYNFFNNIIKQNPFKPQELGTDSSDYAQGFHINWDFVKFIPSYVKRIKINYGIFKRESTFFTYRSTSDYYAHHQNYLDNSPDKQIAVVNEQHMIQSMTSKENAVLYLDLWVWDQSDKQITKYGWSLLDIFDARGNFLPGKYKIPFYPKEMKAHTLFQNGLKYINHNCFCYVSIQSMKEQFEFNKQQFEYESEYYIPPLHQKPLREEIIYQPDSIQIYTSPDDMPQVGIPKKQIISIEPQLTFEMIIKECQDIKLERQYNQSLSSFSSFSASKMNIPSIDSLQKDEDNIGFEITINGFSNIYFSTNDFFQIKGVFMKYDKIIVDEDNKRTVTQDYLLISKDSNNSLKCEFDINYKVNFDGLNISNYDENQQSGEKQNENEYYLFYCFYNHNGKLIGWTDVDLFDIENKTVVLKQGKFSLQLFNPPLLKPPFFGPKTCSIIEMKYEVTGNQEIKEKKKKREERKKTFLSNQSKRQAKNVEEIEEEDEQEKSKTELLELNEKHYIKIEILSLKNYIFTRNTFGCNVINL